MTPTEARKALEGVWAELKAVDESLRVALEARSKLRQCFRTLVAVDRTLSDVEAREVPQ